MDPNVDRKWSTVILESLLISTAYKLPEKIETNN